MNRAALVWLATFAFTGALAAAEIAPDQRRSGSEFMASETRAMQDDPGANPGMLAVLDGESLWSHPDGGSGKSCADCHGGAPTTMKGIAAHYPKFDATLGRPLDLEQRINFCRTERQQSAALPFDSKDLLALTAYVAYQSQGEPIAVADDQKTRPFIDAGRQIFERRQGQLNLSCAQCHDDNWGRHLAGAPIPQAHPTGYPIYRLEWQGVGSVRRRLRGCMVGMRVEPYREEAPEIVDLELYLVWRANGMPVETPAVRP